MMAADRVIRWTTAGAVLGVAAVASYEHAYALCGGMARQDCSPPHTVNVNDLSKAPGLSLV
jgi:hypothetical protein